MGIMFIISENKLNDELQGRDNYLLRIYFCSIV